MQAITQTSDACANMIVSIRQLRLSVLDLFTTLADSGPDPSLDPQPQQESQQQLSSNNGGLYHQQTISKLTASHSLCTASAPALRIQKQQEQQQQQDLLQYVNNMISNISATLRNLDQDMMTLAQNANLINTGESVHLGLDCLIDKHNLYLDLCQAFKTYSKLHDYSGHCHQLLLQQSLKRVHKRTEVNPSGPSAGGSQSKEARIDLYTNAFNLYNHKSCLTRSVVVSLLDNSLKKCEFMEGVYTQPFGRSTGVFQISVNKVLKAILILRGIVIDAVIVKAYHESFASRATKGSATALLAECGQGSEFVDQDEDIDLWSESRYAVFRRLTHHANAAVLHFQYPSYPEIAVRSFLVS